MTSLKPPSIGADTIIKLTFPQFAAIISAALLTVFSLGMLFAEFRSHVASEGHPRTVERVYQTEKAIALLTRMVDQNRQDIQDNKRRLEKRQ